MKKLSIHSAAGPYHVLVGSGIRQHIEMNLHEHGLTRPASLVSNTTVAPLYGDQMARSLQLDGCVELPDGEQFKRWTEIERLCQTWLASGLTRRDTVIAVGGGVCTDTAGFAAAIYLRGIPWIAMPTTLLAMVDASVGGKTGINLDEGKNLVGAFWPPGLVIADVDTLATLPEREIKAGLAEAVKTAWIRDRSVLSLIDACGTNYEPDNSASWVQLVEGCVRIKAEIVAEDEYEAGARQQLNLGHTLGHALEAVTDYSRFLHGEAVAWGLLAVAEISRRRGLLDDDAFDQLAGAVRSLAPLPAIADLSFDEIATRLQRDKKRHQAGIAWVLPTRDGVVLDQRVEAEELRSVVDQIARNSALVGED